METIQKIVIKHLKKITWFLEKRWNKSTSVNTFPVNSLAPKVLIDEKDLKTIQHYLTSLKEAIDAKDINNIAITGSYGSGKSTILKTFQHLYRDEYEFLNISLASFKDNKDKYEDPEFERRLEVSILQQMFYHVEPSKIPDSRFKRIINLTPKKLFFPTIFLMLWILCTLILFKFDYIEMLNPKGWRFNYPLNGTATVSSLIFFIGIGQFVKNVYRLFKNSKINKINIKGELELGETIDKSVFNQHLEEILYFFERTDFNVIVIEDVDRFESTDIFTKLREINILINNSNLIKQPVKFVYAIKDEMFKDKNERVKFFEFIIPVISFINPSNASDQLTKLITHAQLQDVLSADVTSDVVTFIDDIDMRLLINIFHEYQLSRSILSSELKQDNLFAITVYKNLYPDDFGELQKRKGKLYDFFYNKPTYTSSIIELNRAQIEEIDKQIELMENEVDRSIMELRSVYINKLVSKLDKFHAFHINGKNVSLIEVLENVEFRILKGSTSTSYITYVGKRVNNYACEVVPSSAPTNTEINFSEIEKEISNKLTYNQREKLLIDKSNNQINTLKVKKEKIKHEISEVESMTIQRLFEVIDTEQYLGCFSENNLMRNLLLNGYIDEHYDDYISLFHEVNLTKQDYTFERKVKSGYSLPFDHTITKADNLVKRLPDRYFRKEEMLNYKLLSFLLENESKYEVKIDYFFKGLSTDGERQFEFIYGFIKNNPERINTFIEKLCSYKPTLWQYIQEKSGLPEEKIDGLLKHIFDYADKISISQFNSRESLEAYLTKMNDFFAFCSSLKQTNTIQSFVTERKIIFENLDLPNETQKQIFEAIYKRNLYQLNQHNIFSIIKGNGETFDESKLNVAHYTTLLESDLKNLLSYIDNNIEYYIEHVLLLQESNTEEEEETVVDILNRDDVNNDWKSRLIKSQNIVIGSLELIDDVDVKQIVLKNNKLNVNWINVFDYYDATENVGFDDLLIDFLNEERNYIILAKQKLSVKEIEGEKLSNILIQCDQLGIQAYTSLIDSLPYIYKRVGFDNLNIDKIEALLSKRKLILNTNNFDDLKSKGNNLHIKLVEVHQNTFIEKMNELALEADDYLKSLKSTIITAANKLRFIQEMDDDVVINNSDIAKEVCTILPEDKIIPLSYEVLSAIFDARNSASKKISLLNLNFDNLENYQVQTLTEKLRDDYVKIFIKQHKPTFTNTPQHTSLFEKLQKRDLIIRYEVMEKKNKIKVFAKY